MNESYNEVSLYCFSITLMNASPSFNLKHKSLLQNERFRSGKSRLFSLLHWNRGLILYPKRATALSCVRVAHLSYNSPRCQLFQKPENHTVRSYPKRGKTFRPVGWRLIHRKLPAFLLTGSCRYIAPNKSTIGQMYIWRTLFVCLHSRFHSLLYFGASCLVSDRVNWIWSQAT